MTHDAHLPTIEQIMNGNPFEIVDTPWGKMEAWRASTMASGTMGALAQVAAIVRTDAAELEQKAAALDAKKSAVLSTVNRLLRFMSRVDELGARIDALEAKHKADEATQRKLDEEPIELPPDIAEYQTRMRSVGDRRRDASTRRRVAFHRGQRRRTASGASTRNRIRCWWRSSFLRKRAYVLHQRSCEGPSR